MALVSFRRRSSFGMFPDHHCELEARAQVVWFSLHISVLFLQIFVQADDILSAHRFNTACARIQLVAKGSTNGIGCSAPYCFTRLSLSGNEDIWTSTYFLD